MGRRSSKNINKEIEKLKSIIVDYHDGTFEVREESDDCGTHICVYLSDDLEDTVRNIIPTTMGKYRIITIVCNSEYIELFFLNNPSLKNDKDR